MARTQQTAQTKALKAQHTQHGVTLNKQLQISLISLAQLLLSDTRATSTRNLKCLNPHTFFAPDSNEWGLKHSRERFQNDAVSVSRFAGFFLWTKGRLM